MPTLLRAAGFVVLAIAAIVAFVVLAPKVVSDSPTLPSATQYESLISTALSDYDANNSSTESAPQQQVVNGWIAKDMLTIIAKEQADILKAQGAVVDATGNLQTQPFDERVPALLVIAVLTLCWSGVSSAKPLATSVSAPIAGQLPAPTS